METALTIILAIGVVGLAWCMIFHPDPKFKLVQRPKTYEEGIIEGRKQNVDAAVAIALKVVEDKAYDKARQKYRKKLARMRKTLYMGNGWNCK